MPIRLPDAPPNALDVIRRDAPRFLGTSPAGSEMRAMSARTQSINVTMPHRVFTATLDDVLGSRLLANARETAWRYVLVRDDDTPFAAAEVAGDALAHVNEGPFIEGVNRAIIAAEELETVQQREYEMRLLRIPALYVVAVWLHADDDDVLLPAAPAPSPLEANVASDEARLTEALRPLAEQRRDVGDERA